MESKTATCGTVLTVLLWRGGRSTEVDCDALVLFGVRETGCFKEVASLHSDQVRQALLCLQVTTI